MVYPRTNKNGLYLLLAAGFSRRFGAPKLLQTLPSGKSVIATSISALKASNIEFLVAIREDDERLNQKLGALDVGIIKVSKAEEGLASVIAECASKLDTSELNWLGICLADMPYISPNTLTSLAAYTSATTIVRPRYQEKFGHPVLFGSQFFSELCMLEGDDGAKSVLSAHLDKLHLIDVDDPMILHDIDVPEDIIQAEKPGHNIP